MRVVMLSNEFPPSVGGVQTHVLELSRALVRAGHRVRVITRLKPGLAQRELVDGVEVQRLRLPKSHLLYDWLLARTLKKIVQSEAVDIVHVHGMRPLNACRDLPCPVIFTNHTSAFVRRASGGERRQRKSLAQLKCAREVLAVSPLLLEKTRACGYRRPVTLITNGVDPERFCPGPSELRARLGIDGDAFVVAVACRLAKVKGIRYLAQAVADIDDPRLHLVIAGDGEERRAIETILAGKIASGRAHLLGPVDNREMPEIYRGANASALPSLMEGTSVAGLEAMACGLAMVGTRVGGNPLIIEEGETGLLVEPGNPQQLRGALETLLADPARAEGMGRAARARVEQSFTWARIAAQVCERYESLLCSAHAEAS